MLYELGIFGVGSLALYTLVRLAREEKRTGELEALQGNLISNAKGELNDLVHFKTGELREAGERALKELGDYKEHFAQLTKAQQAEQESLRALVEQVRELIGDKEETIQEEIRQQVKWYNSTTEQVENRLIKIESGLHDFSKLQKQVADLEQYRNMEYNELSNSLSETKETLEALHKQVTLKQITQLPELQQKIYWAATEGLTYAEIARKVGSSEAYVGNVVRNLKQLGYFPTQPNAIVLGEE